MKREDHQKVDKLYYGKEGLKYYYVHQWLDETYKYHVGYGQNPYKHWIERHNRKAIGAKYGWYTKEYNIAYLHILSDWLHHFLIATVPETEKNVEELLQSLGVI